MDQANGGIVDRLWRAAEKRLPDLSPDEQRVALVLFDELSGGEPVTAGQLANALAVAKEEADHYLRESTLSSLAHVDDGGAVLGFLGLSTVPTPHRFIVSDQSLWTWCAGDTLFLPELIGATALVESNDPESGEPIRLTVSPTAVKLLDPDSVMLSMNAPEVWDVTSARQIMATACHYIHFFASAESGRRWADRHPSSVLIPVDSDAFTYAQRHNKRLFGDELTRRAAVDHPS